jgi:Domain of unknown function (DUF1902)
MNSIIVKAEWDPEASVWVAQSDDVLGLAAESSSLESLRPKVLAMISDLIEVNKMKIELSEIPVHIVAHSLESVRRDHIGLHSFRSMSLMDARRRKARAF